MNLTRHTVKMKTTNKPKWTGSVSTDARNAVACPRCGVSAGQDCQTVKGRKRDVHLGRITALYGTFLNYPEECYTPPTSGGVLANVLVRLGIINKATADHAKRAAGLFSEMLQALKDAEEILKGDDADQLEHMVDGHDEADCVLCRIRALIAKAEGWERE